MDTHNPSTTLPTPTAFLPPLFRLSSLSTHDIADALQRIRNLYFSPPLSVKLLFQKHKTAKLIPDYSLPDSGYASAEENEDDDDDQAGGGDNDYKSISEDNEVLEIIRSDPLERGFAIKWISGFITRSDTWISLANCDEENTRTELLEEASSLLSAFAGDDSAGDEEKSYTRLFSFPANEGAPIKVELNDGMILEDDHTSVGLQSWGSSIVLAKKMCASPGKFSLHPYSTESIRILELGAGTGLISITAAKILQRLSPLIVATDYHPEVIANLSANIAANFTLCDPLPVAVHMLDWESPVYSSPLDKAFDVILAADVIYHPEHAQWIKGCVERLLARPGAGNATGGVFWMIMALRTAGRHEGLDNTVTAMFPKGGNNTCSGLTLAVLESEDVIKIEGVGRADESGYRLFKIGWWTGSSDVRRNRG